MKKITKILLATDFSEDSYNAYKYALQLINNMKVEMIVLHVIPAMIPSLELPLVDQSAKKDRLGEAAMKMKAFIERGISETSSPGVNYYEKIHTSIEIGDPVKNIGQTIDSNQIKLTITGRRGQNNNLLKSLGTVSLSLLNDLKSDVFIIPSKTEYKTIKKVGFAMAYYNDNPYYITKTKEIFQNKDLEFEYVHIATQNKANYAEANLSQPPSNRFNNKKVQWSTISADNIAEALISFSLEKNLDVLVLLERKKGLFQKIFAKNTAKDVIKISEYPILVLKDDTH